MESYILVNMVLNYVVRTVIFRSDVVAQYLIKILLFSSSLSAISSLRRFDCAETFQSLS